MPKLKTNKAASKRFRFTKSGKVKASHAYKNHILTKKSMDRKRKLRKSALVHETNLKAIAELLPYGR